MRRQHELDRQVEKQPEPVDDVVARDMRHAAAQRPSDRHAAWVTGGVARMSPKGRLSPEISIECPERLRIVCQVHLAGGLARRDPGGAQAGIPGPEPLDDRAGARPAASCRDRPVFGAAKPAAQIGCRRPQGVKQVTIGLLLKSDPAKPATRLRSSAASLPRGLTLSAERGSGPPVGCTPSRGPAAMCRTRLRPPRRPLKNSRARR